jgi:glycosyltransferase involved in cell wall biosynthesis
MNILFADQFSETGGAQLALMDILAAALDRGWSPHVALPGNGRFVEWCDGRGIPVYELPLRPQGNGRKTSRDWLRFFFDIQRMRSMLQEIAIQQEIDLVYVNGPRVLPATVGLGLPLIFHAHSDVANVWGNAIRLWAARQARVIAVSSYSARSFSKASIIYNGVAEHYRGVRVPGKTRIAILGRIAREKGHLDFVRAAKSIGSDNAVFSVYGDALFGESGYADEVRKEANGAVEFRGWQDDIAGVLRDVDILAVPSFGREASTRVIMEAFSAGVPVVAYRSGGIPELIEDGVTGILTESLEDALLMGKLSAAGRAEWQKRFTLERFQQAVCEVIEVEAQARKSDRDRVIPRASEYRRDRLRRDARDPVR